MLVFVLVYEVTTLKMATEIVYHVFRRRASIKSNTCTLADSGYMHYAMDRKMHCTCSREELILGSKKFQP
jgi:hypothetical protein